MDVRQKTQGMFEILEARRTIIARPLVHRVHESKCDDQQDLAIHQTRFPVRKVRMLVVDDIQSLFEVLRINQRENGPNVGILDPEQALGKIEWRQLGQSPSH